MERKEGQRPHTPAQYTQLLCQRTSPSEYCCHLLQAEKCTWVPSPPTLPPLPMEHTQQEKVCVVSWRSWVTNVRTREWTWSICTALLTSFEIRFPFWDLLFDLSVEKSCPRNAQSSYAGIVWHSSRTSAGHLFSGQRWQQCLPTNRHQAILAWVMLCHLNTSIPWMLDHVDRCAFPLPSLGLFLFVLCLSLCTPVSPFPSLPFCLPSLYWLPTQDIFQSTKCNNTFITPG